MKKEIWIATSIYILSVIFLATITDILLLSNIDRYIIILFLFLIAFALGYSLNSYILSEKFKVDANLLHLTKEILHELNIPLSTIQANTTLLRRTLKDNEKGIKRLARIDESSKRLNRLYHELIYSIKKEIHTIEKETFDVKEIVEDRVLLFKQLDRNDFILSLSPLIISADKIGFEKMLDNIIGNAMKYSDKEKPIVITIKDSILSIKDSGIGIDEMELIKIYDRYYQSDNHIEGDGIGLSLVKAYCDDENIKIRIQSQKNMGTEVKFNLTNVKI